MGYPSRIAAHDPTTPSIRRAGRLLSAFVGFAVPALLLPHRPAQSAEPPAAAAQPGQLRFVANRGQWQPRVAFAIQGGTTPAWLCEDGFTFRIERRAESAPDRVTGAVAHLRFRGASPDVRVEGAGDTGPPSHFFLGRDPAGWVVGAPSYPRVTYRGLYDGVDVDVREVAAGPGRGAFAYDLRLEPHADLARVTVRCEGIDGLTLAADGSLRIRLTLGDGSPVCLVQEPPVSWRVGADGTTRPVASRFRLLDRRTFGFAVDGWDGTEPLVVDPGFVWATYLGGGSSDSAFAVRRAPDGTVVVAGWAGSMDFPVTPGAFATRGGQDAFVARLAEDGRALLWSTYLGGVGGEEIHAVDVDATGAVVVGGWTGSGDFPITGGVYQPQYYGGSLLQQIGDAFVTRLRADGAALEFSTFLGRVGDDFVEAVHVDDQGTITVGGYTTSDLFPTTPGAAQTAFRSTNVLVPDGFVARLPRDGSALIWSTLLGGEAQDMVFGMDVDARGRVTVAGLTASEDYPITAGAYQRVVRGTWNGFVTQLEPDGSAMRFSTFFGGDGYDQIRAVRVDRWGEVVVAGRTSDGGPFPLPEGAYQAGFGGREDGFVARLSADGSALRAATLVGGRGDDSCEALVLAPGGDVFVAGRTAGDGFPVGLGAAQPAYGGDVSDGFVVRLDGALQTARYATFAGGNGKDVVRAIDLDPNGDDLLVAGWTWSADLPVSALALQPVTGGSSDAFALRVSAAPDRSAQIEVAEKLEPTARTFAAGAQVVALAPTVRNDSGRQAELRQVGVLVAGWGDAPRELRGVRLYRDVAGNGTLDPEDSLLGGPVPPLDDNQVVVLPGGGRRLGPGETLDLLVVLDTAAACAQGAEFVAGLPASGALELRYLDDGRRMPVTGSLARAGPSWSCGLRLPFGGDVDGDQRVTCRDVRGLVGRLGAAAVPELDPDRDGVVTSRDIDLLLGHILERPLVFHVDGSLDRGLAGTVQGYDLAAPLRITLDGRAVPLVLLADREVLFQVEDSLPPGSASLQIELDGRVLPPWPVEIR